MSWEINDLKKTRKPEWRKNICSDKEKTRRSQRMMEFWHRKKQKVV